MAVNRLSGKTKRIYYRKMSVVQFRKKKLEREPNIEKMLMVLFMMDHIDTADILQWYTRRYKVKVTLKDNGAWHDTLIFEDDRE
jgi:hypothetical protein